MRIATVILLVGLVGCTGSPTRMPLPAYDRGQCRELGWAEAYVKGRVFASFVPVNFNNTIVRAMEEAIRQNQGNAITDVTVTQRWSYGVIVITTGVKVRGMVLRCGAGQPESDYERGRREERERMERGK